VLYARSIHKRIITRPDDRKLALIPIRDVNPTRIRPFATWALIAACVVVYFFVQPSAGTEEAPSYEYAEFIYENAAIACELTTGEPLTLEEINSGKCSDVDTADPYFADKNIWLAAIVSMFLHGGIVHILFNMWSLWIFGNNVEEAFGVVGYLALYLVTGIAATAGFVVFNADQTVPLIGASGAIAGVMGAYLVLFPRHLVMTFFFFTLVGIPAAIFLGIWFIGQFALVNSDGSIAWQAHVAGFLTGMAIAAPLRKKLLANTLNPVPPQRESSSMS
jgi:membrane associated rhomboid family serine protease